MARTDVPGSARSAWRGVYVYVGFLAQWQRGIFLCPSPAYNSLGFPAATNWGGALILSRLATVLALSLLGTSITIADKIYFQTTARDPGVKHSISFEILGP